MTAIARVNGGSLEAQSHEYLPGAKHLHCTRGCARTCFDLIEYYSAVNLQALKDPALPQRRAIIDLMAHDISGSMKACSC